MASPEFPGFHEDPSQTPGAGKSQDPGPKAPPPLAAYEFAEDDAKPVVKKSVAPVHVPPPAPVAPVVTPAVRGSNPAPAAKPSAPTEANSEDEDPDLKPGSRKDLWACPHCETRNKPQRTTCRSCGKSPADAVAAPWFLRPVTWIAAVAVIGCVVGGVMAMRPDLTLKEPMATYLDKKVRLNSAPGPERQIDGRTFFPKGRLSVVGRVVISRPVSDVSHVTTVVLALGASGKDDAWHGVTVNFNGTRVDVSGGNGAVLHLVGDKLPDLTPGAWLSLVGEHGILADGITKFPALDDGLTVVPEQFKP